MPSLSKPVTSFMDEPLLKNPRIQLKFCFSFYLEDSVECDESSGPADSGGTVNNDRPLLSADPFSERPDKPDESLWWFGNSEIRPRREVEVPDGPDGVAAHDAELGHVPVGEVALVQDCHLQGEKISDVNIVVK